MEKGKEGKPLFTDVCSTDLLGFSFGGRSYKDQLDEAIAKTQVGEGREGGREGEKGDEDKSSTDTKIARMKINTIIPDSFYLIGLLWRGCLLADALAQGPRRARRLGRP